MTLPDPLPIPDLSPAPEGWLWTVLHCRPRCEKKAGTLSRQRPARMYLPCLRRVHNYGARVRAYDVPLFPGYLFACIRREDRAWFRQSPYVANLLEVTNEAHFLEPLRAVATALSKGVALEVLPALSPGRKVQVTGGPMKGLVAEIREVRGENRLVLHLDLIQQTVAMEIDVSYVKLID